MKTLPWILLTALVFFIAGFFFTLTFSQQQLECPNRMPEFEQCVKSCTESDEEMCHWQCAKVLGNQQIDLL